MSINPPCCPRDSHPAAHADRLGVTTQLRGRQVSIGTSQRSLAYVVEPRDVLVRNENRYSADSHEVKAAVIVFHDIFGYGSARTHHICDDLAKEGFFVIAPECFGEQIVADPTEFISLSALKRVRTLIMRYGRQFGVIERQLTDEIIPYIRSNTRYIKISILRHCRTCLTRSYY
jgi:hypothetical protein